jgi:putative transposase
MTGAPPNLHACAIRPRPGFLRWSRTDLTFSLTLRIAEKKSKALADPRLADAVMEEILAAECSGFYRLIAFVVMPDHIHILLNPERPPSVVARRIQSGSGRKINWLRGRLGERFWGERFYSHCIHEREQVVEFVAKIESNPVRAGLVPSAERWFWSSAYVRGAAPPPAEPIEREEPSGLIVLPPLSASVSASPIL